MQSWKICRIGEKMPKKIVDRMLIFHEEAQLCWSGTVYTSRAATSQSPAGWSESEAWSENPRSESRWIKDWIDYWDFIKKDKRMFTWQRWLACWRHRRGPGPAWTWRTRRARSCPRRAAGCGAGSPAARSPRPGWRTRTNENNDQWETSS